MFLYRNWHRFCAHASENYNCVPASELHSLPKGASWVVIKHDVETSPLKALCLAEIEYKYGIRATYYFQADLIKDNLNVLKRIADLGHEVSYHYDVLDACAGDFLKAEKDFNHYVEFLRSNGFPTVTVCPHGNPVLERTGWNSNKDFFRNDEITERYPDILDIVVHSNRIDSDGYTYISDAGYAWNIITNVDSNDVDDQPNTRLPSIEDVIKTLDSATRSVVSTHPHRWHSSSIGASVSKAPFHILKFCLKPLIRFSWVRKALSPFYSLAKRF